MEDNESMEKMERVKDRSVVDAAILYSTDFI